MDERTQKIISLIKAKGPVIPSQISTEIGYDQIMTSAMLSELVDSKTLMISHVKVGSSPLYYLPEQKYSLENFTDNLQPKEKEAFLLLRKKTLLNDSKLEPAFRVALRNIRDFAVPIKVSQDNEEKIFWRFYSSSKEDAIKNIKEIMQKIKPAKKTEKKIEMPALKPQLKPQKPKKMSKHDLKMIKLKEEIMSYSKSNNIEIVEEMKTKKRSEVHMLASIESAIGKLQYLVIANDKNSISNNDITLAYHKGQSSRLPVLLLSKGKLTKGAEKYVNSLKSQLIYRKL